MTTMDINETLRRLRTKRDETVQVVNALNEVPDATTEQVFRNPVAQQAFDGYGYGEVVGDLMLAAGELADTVSDLDEWLSRGGFAPADWTTEPRRVCNNTLDDYLAQERDRANRKQTRRATRNVRRSIVIRTV